MVTENAIAGVLAAGTPSEAACRKLVDLALEGGGEDNVTVVLARYRIPPAARELTGGFAAPWAGAGCPLYPSPRIRDRRASPNFSIACFSMCAIASSIESVKRSRSRSRARDRPGADHLVEQRAQGTPVVLPEDDDREVLDLARLHEGRGLEELVHGADAARHDDEGVGVLHEHQLPHEEVLERDVDVEVRVELLLLGQHDVAADRAAAGLPCAAVGGLHDPRASAGHDGEPEPREPRAGFPGERIVRMVGAEARRSEDRHARAHEVERAEPADELEGDADDRGEFALPRARPFEEPALLRLRPGAGRFFRRGTVSDIGRDRLSPD